MEYKGIKMDFRATPSKKMYKSHNTILKMYKLVNNEETKILKFNKVHIKVRFINLNITSFKLNEHIDYERYSKIYKLIYGI